LRSLTRPRRKCGIASGSAQASHVFSSTALPPHPARRDHPRPGPGVGAYTRCTGSSTGGQCGPPPRRRANEVRNQVLARKVKYLGSREVRGGWPVPRGCCRLPEGCGTPLPTCPGAGSPDRGWGSLSGRNRRTGRSPQARGP
jgi:hypothetical protein